MNLTRTSSHSAKWLTLSAACLGLAMLMIDTFVVNVAFPAISRDLKADLSAAQWAVSGYVLMTGVLPIALGRLGDIFGRRRIYLFGLCIFIAASIACGAATSITLLVIFRFVQGIGAAIMMPSTLSIITQAFPPQQRGLAIGIWSGVSGLGLIAGPILGGLLVQGDNWRLIFYVNVPLGALALLLAMLFVPESRDESVPRTVDVPGLALLSSALFLIMFGVTRANSDGWTSPFILGCFVLGIVLLPIFVAVERRTRYPLIDLSLFRNRTFVMACLSAFLFSASVFGSQPYTSLFLQNFWGYTPLQGGLAFLPATVLVAALMPVSGVLGQKLGSRLRLIIIGGSLMVATSFVYLMGLTLQSGYVDGLLPAFILRGAGIGLVMASTSFAVMSAVPLAKAGLASGTLTMARNLGTAMGVALCGAVFLHSVDTQLTERLGGVPSVQVTQIAAAAEHFATAGSDATHAIVSQAILASYIQLALAGAVSAAVATLAAVFIRHRVPAAQPAALKPKEVMTVADV